MQDRFDQFKDSTAALIEYREAYLKAKKENPEAVKGLPDPDGDPSKFDPAEALMMLRKGGEKLRAVPPIDVTS